VAIPPIESATAARKAVPAAWPGFTAAVPVVIRVSGESDTWRARIDSITGAQFALAVYALVLAFLLGRLATGVEISRRLRRTARRVDDGAALRWLRWHALAMGVDRPPLLIESAAVTVPLTLGAWRPVILLPDGWRAWENAKLSAVIAHELSHVQRKDARTKALALAYQAFFWFSPLSWWLESHLAALGEQASDLAAIGAGAEPGYYAEVLMSFFQAIQARGARVCRQGVAMARLGSRFVNRGGRAQDRIERVLSSNGILRAKPRARLLALMALVAAPIVYLTAATRPVLVASPAGHAAVQWPAPPPPAAPTITPMPPEAPAARLIPSAMPVPPAAPSAAMSPSAPIPPPGWLQGPEPPPPPEPLQGEDDDWTINNIHEGMSFAIVHGKSVMMNGSGDDQDEVRDLQKKIGGDFIWFVHAGNSYVIRDSATVQRAIALYAPMEDLGRQQELLGRQQEELGRKQEALGKQQEEVRIKVPADLEERVKKVEDEIRRLGPDASQEDLGRLQGELGDLQGYIGDLQGKAGDEQGKLGGQQGELGRQQGQLGEKQGELGRRQGEIAREAAHKMQGIMQQALADGKAQRAPQ
jgi:bla regulator protein blaR1